jgi:hypothetical protein
VQPLGGLGPQQDQIVATVGEYLAAFFGLLVRRERPPGDFLVPPLARRKGFEYCTAHLCTMAGVNNLHESDAHPTWLCPECLAKVCWSTGQRPAEHQRRMLAFATAHAMPEEEAFYRASLAALGEAP